MTESDHGIRPGSSPAPLGRKPSVTLSYEDGHAIIEHWCLNRGQQPERIKATLPNGRWEVISIEPLTVSPSVHCTWCGLHGWITDGEFWTTGGPR